MTTARPSFGFESRAGQFSYPFLISGMLLVHRYVYPENPDLRSAEFYLSLALLVLYVICRKFISVETRVRRFRHLRMLEKIIEVYIGVTVISSLIFTLILSVVG